MAQGLCAGDTLHSWEAESVCFGIPLQSLPSLLYVGLAVLLVAVSYIEHAKPTSNLDESLLRLCCQKIGNNELSENVYSAPF